MDCIAHMQAALSLTGARNDVSYNVSLCVSFGNAKSTVIELIGNSVQ